jgi:hypothetical protein
MQTADSNTGIDPSIDLGNGSSTCLPMTFLTPMTPPACLPEAQSRFDIENVVKTCESKALTSIDASAAESKQMWLALTPFALTHRLPQLPEASNSMRERANINRAAASEAAHVEAIQLPVPLTPAL